jgi:ABC-type branched-subunit amino acid transport system ATPase component
LIGPNGAGKTTTFNACCGLVPSRGRIELDGADISALGPAERARRGLGRTFQKMEVFENQTVGDNVELGYEATLVSTRVTGQLWATRSQRRQAREVAAAALELCGIAGIAGRPVASLPTGQRRLTELAMTLVGGFSVLLLDEPSSGLDSTETAAFGEILRRLVSERVTAVLLVEHDMTLVRAVCDYLYVLDFGRPLIDGPAGEVLASEAVAAAYLGTEAVTGRV